MEEIEDREVAGERVAFVGESGIPVWHVVVAGVRQLGDARRLAGKLHLSVGEVWTALRYASKHDFEIRSAFRDRSGGEPPSLGRKRPLLPVAELLAEPDVSETAAPSEGRVGILQNSAMSVSTPPIQRG